MKTFGKIQLSKKDSPRQKTSNESDEQEQSPRQPANHSLERTAIAAVRATSSRNFHLKPPADAPFPLWPSAQLHRYATTPLTIGAIAIISLIAAGCATDPYELEKSKHGKWKTLKIEDAIKLPSGSNELIFINGYITEITTSGAGVEVEISTSITPGAPRLKARIDKTRAIGVESKLVQIKRDEKIEALIIVSDGTLWSQRMTLRAVIQEAGKPTLFL